MTKVIKVHLSKKDHVIMNQIIEVRQNHVTMNNKIIEVRRNHVTTMIIIGHHPQEKMVIETAMNQMNHQNVVVIKMIIIVNHQQLTVK